MVGEVVYPSAKLAFDTSKPDGTPRKLLDVSKLHGLGWHHGIDIKEGVRPTYEWFLSNLGAQRGRNRSKRCVALKAQNATDDAHDPYPTFHRMNTRGACRAFLEGAGFEVEALDYIEPEPS